MDGVVEPGAFEGSDQGRVDPGRYLVRANAQVFCRKFEAAGFPEDGLERGVVDRHFAGFIEGMFVGEVCENPFVFGDGVEFECGGVFDGAVVKRDAVLAVGLEGAFIQRVGEGNGIEGDAEVAGEVDGVEETAIGSVGGEFDGDGVGAFSE